MAAGGFVYLYKTTKLPDPNADFETNTSFVYYDDGETRARPATRTRTATRSRTTEMPQDVKDAVVAAENRTFWSDNGIDVKGIARAVFNNASGNATQGASTITQQYIKILYLTQERSYTRKLKEAILSLKLGRQVSKQEILEGYLNTIYFGRGAYGIQAAAQAYFGKSAAELDAQGERGAGEHHQQPDATSTRPTARTRRSRCGSATATCSTGWPPRTTSATPTPPRRGGSCRSSRRGQADDRYGGQKGHVLTMVKNELTDAHQRGDRGAVHRGRDRRRRPADDHDVHVELVGAVQRHAAVLEQLGQHPVGDGRADLGLDVVADDRDAGVLELLGPHGVGGDEDRAAR